MNTETVTPLLVDLSPEALKFVGTNVASGFGAAAALPIHTSGVMEKDEIESLEARLAAAGHSFAWVRLSDDTSAAAKKIIKSFRKDAIAEGWEPKKPDDEFQLAAIVELSNQDDQIGDDVLALFLKAPSTAFGTEGHAEIFMVGDLMRAAKLRFMDLAVPWSQLSEGEQERVLTGLADDVRRAAQKAIRIIAHHGRIEFRAQVEQVNFKGEAEVKATLKLMANSEAHSLADVAGGFVTVIIEQNDELLAIPDDMTKGEPDQRPLFDRSTEPAAA